MTPQPPSTPLRCPPRPWSIAQHITPPLQKNPRNGVLRAAEMDAGLKLLGALHELEELNVAYNPHLTDPCLLEWTSLKKLRAVSLDSCTNKNNRLSPPPPPPSSSREAWTLEHHYCHDILVCLLGGMRSQQSSAALMGGCLRQNSGLISSGLTSVLDVGRNACKRFRSRRYKNLMRAIR